MRTPSEPVFGGTAAIPPPEVFERARRGNPVWYQAVERAYEQFATSPEHAGTYADPKGDGATIQQMWLVYTLFGVEPYCLLSRPLPAGSTDRITRLVECTAAQIIEALTTIQAADGELNVPLAYHDGVTGHCIRITSYDAARDRFTYHDPWPERSLLAKENNAADIDAQPDGSRWSVTRQELERVVFAAFLLPPYWARAQHRDFDVRFDDWKNGAFVGFFHLRQLAERVEGARVQRVFAPGAFKEQITLLVDATQAGKITQASLRVRTDWLAANFLLAIDLAKSFLTAFAPPPDLARYADIAETFWSLRDPRAFAKIRDASPDESEGVRCVQAFLGKLGGADVSTDFGHLSLGSGSQDGKAVQFIEMSLL
jgi:hypothetical protein